MRNGFKAMVMVLGMAALMAAGCAKEDVVKKDEPVVQQQTVQKQEPVKQVEPVKQAEPVKQPEPKIEEAVAPKAAEPISLETVYFDFDKSDLRQDARDVLAKNAEVLLKKAADAKIQIAGHCDERGSDEYNLALGDRRAKSAANYLKKLGVTADRISTISYGEEKPAVDGHDEAAWSKNRRAEFVIVK